jgi:hypothetical protein
MQKNTSEITQPFSELLADLDNTLTPKMVQTNLDSLREGLFAYFKGDKRFLPDLILHADSLAGREKTKESVSTSSKQTVPAVQLPKIEKINLSAILLYTNRSEISDRLSQIRLLFYVVRKLPGILLPILLLLFLAGLTGTRSRKDWAGWVKLSLSTGGFLALTVGTALSVITYFVVPQSLGPIAMSLPLQSDIILAYIRDCLLHSIFFLLIGGAFFLLLSLAVHPLSPVGTNLWKKAMLLVPKTFAVNGQYTRLFLISVFLLASLGLLLFRLQLVAGDFETYEFYSTLDKIRNPSTVTQVIAAKDDTIYTLQLKLVDNKLKEPLQGVALNISGKSGVSGKQFGEDVYTDSEGIAKLALDKGTFRIAFLPSQYSGKYSIPSPFFTDLKSAGTTIITINLDPIPEIEHQDRGIIEVEVLDAANEPIPNAELSIEEHDFDPDLPNRHYSNTNIDGIAVFRIKEGDYRVSFTEAGFPAGYLPPPSFDANAKAGETTRYTIRAVVRKGKK